MKRNSIISMEKLTDDLLLSFKETYPYGFADHVQKVVKPSGETMYVVRFETDEVVYAVKVNPFRVSKKGETELPEDMDNDNEYDNSKDDDMETSDADPSYEMDDLD